MINIKSKEIIIVPLEKINLNPKNRNNHSKEQIDRLCKIIKYQGFRNPLIVSNRTGLLVAGHGRMIAAEELGLNSVPVIYQDFESQEMEYAAGVSDNSIASWAELDLSGINMDLPDLGPDFDLEMLGIKDFILEPIEKLEPGSDEDDAPEVPKESVVKLGDLFQLGNHRLLCGDSTSIDAVEKLMGGEKIDAVITDPPYNVGKGYAGEDLDKDSFEALHRGWLSTASSIAKDDAAFYIYFGVKWLWTMGDICREYLINPRLLIWYRPDGHGAGGGDFFYNFDPIFYGSKTGKFHTRKYDGEFNRDVWIINKAKEKDGGFEHPTVKPILVIEAAVLTSTEAGHFVLDLFGGSGSTLIACEKTNRKCFMMELDTHYCSVILERWQTYSKKKAFLVNEDGTQTAYDELKQKIPT